MLIPISVSIHFNLAVDPLDKGIIINEQELIINNRLPVYDKFDEQEKELAISVFRNTRL